MPTTARPVAENSSLDPGWALVGAASRHEAVNEASPDGDGSYIQRGIGTASLTGFPAMRLAGMADPGTDDGFELTFVTRNTALGTSSLTVALYQGDPDVAGSLLGSDAIVTGSTGYSPKTWSVPAAVIEDITDFADVWVSWNTASGSGGNLRITQIEMVVPDEEEPPGAGVPMRTLTGAGL
jgi:hypothetical protein